jgi:hypothetical protein
MRKEIPFEMALPDSVTYNGTQQFLNMQKVGEVGLLFTLAVGSAGCGGGTVIVPETGRNNRNAPKECVLKDIPGGGGFAGTHVNENGGVEIDVGEVADGVEQQIKVPATEKGKCATIGIKGQSQGIMPYKVIDGEPLDIGSLKGEKLVFPGHQTGSEPSEGSVSSGK